MTKRLFTRLVPLLMGLFFSVLAQSQTVTFAASPNTVSPNVGDTVRINFVVTNFKQIIDFQFSADWDATLLKFIRIDQKNIPDAPNLLANIPTGKTNCAIIIWNASGAKPTDVTDGQSIFQLIFVAQAASVNFWLKLGNTCTSVEVIQQDANGVQAPVKPQFSFLGIPPDANSTPITVITNSQSVASGQKACEDVTIKTFTNILSAKWDMQWDATVLRFDSVSAFNQTLGITAANFTTAQSGNGTFNFNFSSAIGLTLSDNDKLYQACFTAIGNGSTSTTVQTLTANSSVVRNNTGGKSSVGLTAQNGTVTISGGGVATPVVTFTSLGGSGNIGDTVCMTVSAKNFNSLANINWSMHWDSTKISFVRASTKVAALGIESLVAPATLSSPGNYFSNLTSGSLGFLWQTGNGNGVSIPDGSILYETCFKLIAIPGSAITFNGTPLKFSVLAIDANNNVVKVQGATFPPPTNMKVNSAAPAINETSVLKNITCNGGGDGNIALTVSGGTGTYTYSWTGPNGFTSTLQNISTLSAGVYNVTITSGSATKTDNFTLTQPTVISPVGTVTNSSCGNTPNGGISLVVTGGVAPYTFAWSSGETTQNISNKGAGNYTVTIYDTKLCAITPTQFTITSAPAIAATPTITNVNCKGGNTGMIMTAPSGGTSPYSFSWTGPSSFTSTAQNINGLAAGNYALIVTDAKNCAFTTNYTVTEPATSVVIGAISVTNANCNQSNGGATVASVTGGTSPYSYSWAGGNNITQSTLNLTGVAAGTFNFTAKDFNGCFMVQTNVVVGNTSSTLAIGTPTVKNSACANANGSITISPTGGAAPLKYAWTGPNGFTATTQNISSLAAGAYSVLVNDANNCSINSGAITVSTVNAASGSTQTATNISCNAGTNGSITTKINGGTAPFTYAWTGTNGFTASTKDIANLAAGTYTLNVNDASGCVAAPLVVTLTQPDLLVSSAQTTKNLSCNNTANGSITTSISGGTAPITYAWTGPNSFTAPTKDIANLAAGTYTLNANDALGCAAAPLAVTLTQPDLLVSSVQSTKNLSCNNAANGSIITSISGGTTPYTYAWTGTNGFTASTKDIANLAAGTYTLNVRDANTCPATQLAVTLTQPAAIIVSSQSVTNISCKNAGNGSITMSNVTGGIAPYTYSWTGPNGFTASTKDIKNLAAGGYTLLVTDNAGCSSAPVVVNVIQPDGITIGTPQVTNITCKNGGNGIVTEIVSGGTAPYVFSWTGPNGFTSAAQNISGLSGGTYSLNVSDANKCSASTTATVNEPDSLRITSATITDITCNGLTNGGINIGVAGGTPAYSFSWTGTGGYVYAQQNTGNNLKPGNYSVVVTDKNNCTTSASYTLKQPDSISFSYTSVAASGGCTGTATLNVSGGNCTTYGYSWSGAGFTQASSQLKDQTGLCPGTYGVIVTDCKGCSINRSVTIGGSIAGINIVSTTVVPAGCAGNAFGSIAVTFTGGAAPYTFEWYNKDFPTVVIRRSNDKVDQLPAGTYVVRISDGVQKFVSGDIIVPGASTLLSVTLRTKQNESCNGNDGNIFISVKDGLPPYRYQWNDGASFQDRPNIPAGIYSVVVTDQAMCIKQSPDYAIGKDYCPLNFVFNTKNASCSTTNDGSIFLNIQNGEPGYVIRWTNGIKSDSVRLDISQRSIAYEIKNLGSGIYTVTITDSKGQVKSSIIPVGAPAPIVITKTISPDPGNCNGSIIVSVSGGTAPYNYSWNTGETTRDLFNLCAGSIRSLNVTDFNKCNLQSTNDTILLSITPIVAKSVNITNATCAYDSVNTKIELTITGGAPPYSYTWTNGIGTIISLNKDLADVPAGKYHVVIKDSAKPIPQNTARDYVIGTLSDLKLVDVTSVNVADPNDTTGLITVKVQGGKTPYSFTLSTGATNTTGIFTGLKAGTYSVTLVDAQGCTDNRKDVPVNAATCATVVKNVNPIYNGYDIKCFGNAIGSATVKSVSGAFTAPFTYTWSSNESGQTAFLLSAGSQSVTIKDIKGKTCITSVVITSPDKFNLTLATLDQQHGLDAVVTGGVVPYKYQWTTNDITHDIVGQKPGDYSVLVTDRNGCQLTQTGTIRPITLGCLDAAKVITPDGDGKNDVFLIDRCVYKTVRLEIYNRWGKLVYYNDDYNDTWKGRDADGDGGKPLPEDIYFYILKGTDAVGSQQIAKGTVNIIRP